MLALIHLPLLFAITAQPAVSLPAAALAVYSRSLNACASVTRFDVQEALRRSVSPGKEQSVPGASVCDYAAGAGQVTVSIQRIKVAVDVRAEAESLRTLVPEARLRESPDRDGQAFYLDIPGAGTQFYLVRGSDFVLVSILGCGEASGIYTAARELAFKALDPKRRDDADLPR